MLCGSGDMAQRAFLGAINSAHVGDTDVLKSLCVRRPQSAALEGMCWAAFIEIRYNKKKKIDPTSQRVQRLMNI